MGDTTPSEDGGARVQGTIPTMNGTIMFAAVERHSSDVQWT